MDDDGRGFRASGGGAGGRPPREASSDAAGQRPRRRNLRQLARKLSPDLAPIRHSRDFRLLFFGQAANTTGSVICFVALPYQAYSISHSSLVVGLLSCAELIPVLLAGMIGGALADTLERRKLILIMQTCSAIGMVGLAVNALVGRQLWLLFVFAALLSLCYSLQRPSVEVIVPRLVAHEDLHAASALSLLLGTFSTTLGPLIGGALLVGGAPLAYFVAAGTTTAALIPFALMARSAPGPDADRPSVSGFLEGLRYAQSRKDLLGTYLIDIGAMFFGAPYAVFPQIAHKLGGPAVLGLLYAAPGFGALAVSLTSSWTRHVHHHGRAIALAVCGWGIAIAAFGFAPNLPLSVLALAAAGGADSVSGLFRMTMWNQSIPARVRGRMAGLEMISYSTGEPVGNLEAGALAQLTGSVRIAVVSGGLLSLLGAAIVSLALPALWRYDARDLKVPADGKPTTGEPTTGEPTTGEPLAHSAVRPDLASGPSIEPQYEHAPLFEDS